jgi:hypothetical protein
MEKFNEMSSLRVISFWIDFLSFPLSSLSGLVFLNVANDSHLYSSSSPSDSEAALDASISAVGDSSPLMLAKSSLTTTALKEISFFSSLALSMLFSECSSVSTVVVMDYCFESTYICQNSWVKRW